MAETTWTEEQTAGPKKKSVPTWVWFCGGGCLLAVLLAVVAAGFGFQFINRATDPDLQWEKLSHILPHDERPAELEPKFGWQIGVEQYTFHHASGFQLQLQNHTGADATRERSGMFNAENPSFPKNMGIVRFEDFQGGQVEVQGRSLAVIRMRMEFPAFMKKMMPKESQDAMGSMAFVDLTPEGRDGMLIGQFTRMAGSGPITDEEIRVILKPFHIGPNR